MNAKIKNVLNAIWAFLKNTGEKIQDTHPFIQIVSFLVIAGILFVIFLSIAFTPHMRRTVYYFQNASSGAICSEIRYLPQVSGRETKLSEYVSESLLGPVTPAFRPLFNSGTKIIDCFARKNTAYINLSPEALLPGPGITESKLACKLFKKNVCTNIRSIDKIYLYVDGIEVYSENPYADASEKNKKR